MLILSVSVWVSAFFSVCMLIILCHQPFLYLFGQSVSSVPPLRLLHRQAGPSCHDSTLLQPMISFYERRENKTKKKKTHAKQIILQRQTPTAHWANSSYQPKIRLCKSAQKHHCQTLPYNTHTGWSGGVPILIDSY